MVETGSLPEHDRYATRDIGSVVARLFPYAVSAGWGDNFFFLPSIKGWMMYGIVCTHHSRTHHKILYRRPLRKCEIVMDSEAIQS